VPEVEVVGREAKGDDEQHELHADLRHRAQHAARRDRGRDVETVLPEEADLDGGVSGHGYGQIRERHRDLQLDTRPDRDPDRHVAEERHAVHNVAEHAEHERQHDEGPVGVPHRVPELRRATDSAEQRRQRDERRDRHQHVARVDSVQRTGLGRFGSQRMLRGLAETFEVLIEVGAAAERVVRPSRQRQWLYVGKRDREFVAQYAFGRGDRAVGPDDGCGRGEQFGDVACRLRVPHLDRRRLEAHDARSVVCVEHVMGVELPVRNSRTMQRPELGPQLRQRRVRQLVAGELREGPSDGDSFREQRDAMRGAGTDQHWNVHAVLACETFDRHLVRELPATRRR
jgi:hypothetical protein